MPTETEKLIGKVDKVLESQIRFEEQLKSHKQSVEDFCEDNKIHHNMFFKGLASADKDIAVLKDNVKDIKENIKDLNGVEDSSSSVQGTAYELLKIIIPIIMVILVALKLSGHFGN